MCYFGAGVCGDACLRHTAPQTTRFPPRFDSKMAASSDAAASLGPTKGVIVLPLHLFHDFRTLLAVKGIKHGRSTLSVSCWIVMELDSLCTILFQPPRKEEVVHKPMNRDHCPGHSFAGETDGGEAAWPWLWHGPGLIRASESPAVAAKEGGAGASCAPLDSTLVPSISTALQCSLDRRRAGWHWTAAVLCCAETWLQDNFHVPSIFRP
ncbi:uncharacterized protein LOC132382534 [Hypanus sabinus]|uniref:uncharacterized protein LOC132382534 n=1 Tax=Hypanus sabinus TaxID=79690 RepID=UPI0028C4B6CF|nr:uncharacterized protein LOC132382534 [Hypanus sabinus]